MRTLIDDPDVRSRIERALEAAAELQRRGALPPVLADLLLLLDGIRGEVNEVSEVREAGAQAEDSTARIAGLVRTLADAEQRLEFVALSFLRDRLLPEATGSSAVVSAAVVHEAIRSGVVLTARIDNPRNASRPTTTVRLNRRHPAVRALLPDAGMAEPFQPIELRGEALSETVLRERR